MYYSSAPPTDSNEGDNDINEDGDTDDDERDDETIITGGDAMFGIDSDDEEDKMERTPFGHRRDNMINSSSEPRRIKPGPQQDIDVREGKSVPPQAQLQKVERQFHKFSRKVAVEMVHSAPKVQEVPNETGAFHDKMITPSERELELEAEALKRRKAAYDDFDRLLGLETRTANPVNRIMSSFLGPLMRVTRIFLFIFRICFHISTWRDPFMSFWALVSLMLAGIILIMFPWRTFFGLAIMGLLGPQNILVRRYLEKKAEQDALEYDESESTAVDEWRNPALGPKHSTHTEVSSGNLSTYSGLSSRNRVAWGMAGFGGQYSKKPSRTQHQACCVDGADCQPFRPDHHHAQSGQSKQKNPRSVAIPYTPFKKSRFFDWPPDPTVSRATPMMFREMANAAATTPLTPISSSLTIEKMTNSSEHSAPEQSPMQRDMAAALAHAKESLGADFDVDSDDGNGDIAMHQISRSQPNSPEMSVGLRRRANTAGSAGGAIVPSRSVNAAPKLPQRKSPVPQPPGSPRRSPRRNRRARSPIPPSMTRRLPMKGLKWSESARELSSSSHR